VQHRSLDVTSVEVGAVGGPEFAASHSRRNDHRRKPETGGDHMQKLMLGFMVAIIALAPAIAAAQAGSGASGGSSGGATTGSTTGGSATPSPTASPDFDFEKLTTQADCEKAGGEWQIASNKCAKKEMGAAAGTGTTTTSPAASPSGTSPAASPAGDFSQYTTKAACESAGGDWKTLSNKCEKKK
jgi:hypothetical protein